MKKILICLAVCGMGSILSGCIRQGPGVKAPPGQVKNATGYNPASGKVHVKGKRK